MFIQAGVPVIRARARGCGLHQPGGGEGEGGPALRDLGISLPFGHSWTEPCQGRAGGSIPESSPASFGDQASTGVEGHRGQLVGPCWMGLASWYQAVQEEGSGWCGLSTENLWALPLSFAFINLILLPGQSGLLGSLSPTVFACSGPGPCKVDGRCLWQGASSPQGDGGGAFGAQPLHPSFLGCVTYLVFLFLFLFFSQ